MINIDTVDVDNVKDGDYAYRATTRAASSNLRIVVFRKRSGRFSKQVSVSVARVHMSEDPRRVDGVSVRNKHLVEALQYLASEIHQGAQFEVCHRDNGEKE